MLSLHTNAASLSTQNSLGATQKALSASMSRLGTGYRVNSAMDDAAGLQIATRLNAQSRGMVVAQRNTQNGISMMQTAEGAFGEVTDILQRMKDLATETFTASTSANDKTAMQAEYDALGTELNNIVRSLNTVLAGQRGTIYQQRITAVAQINSLTSSIASLNEKIAATQATGVNASGLIDERDQKIDDLSGFVGLQVVSQADGTRSVALRSGQPLVVGNLAATLVVQTNVSGAQSLQLNFAKESFALRGQGLGGQLGGIGDFEQNVLSPLMQSVSDMAGEIASRFNNQLAAGFAPDGTPGKPLFVFDATSSTHMLQVQPGILPQELGFSADSTQPGNSDNLLTLIGLKQQPITVSALGNVLMGDAYTQLTSVLAMRSQQNEAARGTAQTVRDQAESSWKSTSGVNTDEEAINLMQYQQMYQANMKVIAVANELFNSTLSMMN